MRRRCLWCVVLTYLVGSFNKPPILNRQDLAVECLHERLLHTSIVRPHPDQTSWDLPTLNILSTLSYGCFSEPTVFENYVHDLYVDDQVVELSLWDTAGMSRCAFLCQAWLTYLGIFLCSINRSRRIRSTEIFKLRGNSCRYDMLLGTLLWTHFCAYLTPWLGGQPGVTR